MVKIIIDRIYCDTCRRIINPKDVIDYTASCPTCGTNLIKVQTFEEVQGS